MRTSARPRSRNLTAALALLLGVLSPVPALAAILHVSARIEDGRARLDPALFLDREPLPAPKPGPLTLRILDSSGTVLASVAFAAGTAYAAEEGGCRRLDGLISLTVSLADAAADRMAEIRVLRGEQELGVLRSTAWQPSKVAGEVQRPAPVVPGREPRAVALGGGRVRLTWDHATHPQVILKDPDGSIAGFLRGGSAELDTDRRTLDLDLMDGLRRLPWRVEVEDPSR
ncbi:MAG: hypothetical protein ABSH53_10410 [Holophaga sp.]|jgi:hypothetical protein